MKFWDFFSPIFWLFYLVWDLWGEKSQTLDRKSIYDKLQGDNRFENCALLLRKKTFSGLSFHIFTFTPSKLISQELAPSQGPTVSTMLCHHSFGSQSTRFKHLIIHHKQRYHTASKPYKHVSLAWRRLVCFCPHCDTVVPKQSTADSNHFRRLGADSVGGKCDWEEARLRPQTLFSCVGEANNQRALINTVYKLLLLLV